MVGRVLLTDDHPAVRKTLRALLCEASDTITDTSTSQQKKAEVVIFQ